jgi:hypothetical protein
MPAPQPNNARTAKIITTTCHQPCQHDARSTSTREEREKSKRTWHYLTHDHHVPLPAHRCLGPRQSLLSLCAAQLP